jgi:hypothetical protein
MTAGKTSRDPNAKPPRGVGRPAAAENPRGRRVPTPWLLALACFAAVSLVSRVLGEYLADQASGRWTVFWIYLGWMALILAAGAGAARAAIKASFPHHGERGERSGVGREPADLNQLSRMFQPVMVYFSLLAVLFSLAAMFLAQWSSRGILFEFKTVQLEAMARSGDPRQIDRFFVSVQGLGDPEEVQHFIQKVPPFFDHPDESVRKAAFDAMAVMGHRMNLSVAMLKMDRSLSSERWEHDVVAWLRADVSVRLVAAFEKGTTPRAAVVRAMAWMLDGELAGLFAQLVSDPATPEDVFREAASGLANLGALEGGEALVPQIERYPGQTRLHVLWALAEIGTSQTADEAEEGYEERVLAVVRGMASVLPRQDGAALCALVLALGTFQHSAVTPDLIELFESKRSDIVCPRAEIRLPHGPPVAFVTEQKLRWVLLNLFASIGGNNIVLSEWVAKAARRPGYDEEIAKGLAQLHAQLRQD